METQFLLTRESGVEQSQPASLGSDSDEEFMQDFEKHRQNRGSDSDSDSDSEDAPTQPMKAVPPHTSTHAAVPVELAEIYEIVDEMTAEETRQACEQEGVVPTSWSEAAMKQGLRDQYLGNWLESQIGTDMQLDMDQVIPSLSVDRCTVLVHVLGNRF